MNEFIDINPNINVQESEYKRLLGYPHHYELEGRSKELTDWVRDWYKRNGKPWIYAIKTDELRIFEDSFSINNVKFQSKKLTYRFKNTGVSSIILAVVSAGTECEERAQQLWKEQKPDEYFFMEIFGSAVVEHLITTAGFLFCSWAEKNKLAVLPHYSPGYSEWDVKEQVKLLELINKLKTDNLPGKIHVLDTGMLNPKKSLIGIFGITKQTEKVRKFAELIPCRSCSLASCQYRRTDYKYPHRQIEDVLKLQSKVVFQKEPANTEDSRDQRNKPSLNQHAKYSINLKTLQKWSNDRLEIKILDNNTIEANFHYDGTTCSNLGHLLQFEFYIKLSSPEDGYKLIEMACIPAQGDDGYTYMCEYINDPESLLEKIDNEKPLLGKPLDEVIKWKREFNPEGCFCKEESRRHKWGLVLETLHYSLVQNEIGINNIPAMTDLYVRK